MTIEQACTCAHGWGSHRARRGRGPGACMVAGCQCRTATPITWRCGWQHRSLDAQGRDVIVVCGIGGTAHTADERDAFALSHARRMHPPCQPREEAAYLAFYREWRPRPHSPEEVDRCDRPIRLAPPAEYHSVVTDADGNPLPPPIWRRAAESGPGAVQRGRAREPRAA